MHHLMNDDGPVDLPKNKILGKQWRIKEKLGEGGCGSVYKVINIKTGISAALKAESNFVAGGPVLKLEVQILRRMKGRKHVAQLLHCGKKEQYSYMVMTLLGDSLQKLVNGRTCSVSTQTRVGIQVLYAIKQLHEVGYIHRDVKPANLAIGRRGRESRVVHLLDFGLAREYVLRSPNGKVEMRHPRCDTLFRGTTRYCSANTHTRNEQGRPDDLWSMVYLLVEMRSSLPWERLNDKKDIGRCKIATPDRKLMHNCPVQMLEIAAHLRQVDYYTRPDYLYIYKKFDEVMKAGNFKWSDPYDWEKPSAAGTLTRKIMKTLSVSEEVEPPAKDDAAAAAPAEDDNDDNNMKTTEQPLLSQDTTTETENTTKSTTVRKSTMRSPSKSSKASSKNKTDKEEAGTLKESTTKSTKKKASSSSELFTQADFEKNEIGF